MGFIKVKRADPQSSWLDRLYLPAIFKGMAVTIQHFFQRKFTVQYPEERWIPPPKYRGAIRLNRDEQGRVKCVACELCATVCPADAITVEAGVAPWEDREKYPVSFRIDMLRCILCGFCEEACPEKAIELTEIYDFADYSRQDLIWDRERLLQNYDLTKDKAYQKERAQKIKTVREELSLR